MTSMTVMWRRGDYDSLKKKSFTTYYKCLIFHPASPPRPLIHILKYFQWRLICHDFAVWLATWWRYWHRLVMTRLYRWHCQVMIHRFRWVAVHVFVCKWLCIYSMYLRPCLYATGPVFKCKRLRIYMALAMYPEPEFLNILKSNSAESARTGFQVNCYDIF